MAQGAQAGIAVGALAVLAVGAVVYAVKTHDSIACSMSEGAFGAAVAVVSKGHDTEAVAAVGTILGGYSISKACENAVNDAVTKGGNLSVKVQPQIGAASRITIPVVRVPNLVLSTPDNLSATLARIVACDRRWTLTAAQHACYSGYLDD